MVKILYPDAPSVPWDGQSKRVQDWLKERRAETAKDKRNAADKTIRGLERASEKLADHYRALEGKAKETGDYSFLDKYKPDYFDFGQAWEKINTAIEQLRPATSAVLDARRQLAELDAQSEAIGAEYEQAEGLAKRGVISYDTLGNMDTGKQFAAIKDRRAILEDNLNQLGVPAGRKAWELARDGQLADQALGNADQTIVDASFE